jgi:hypothetical protein
VIHDFAIHAQKSGSGNPYPDYVFIGCQLVNHRGNHFNHLIRVIDGTWNPELFEDGASFVDQSAGDFSSTNVNTNRVHQGPNQESEEN